MKLQARSYHVIYCINIFHVAPLGIVEGIMRCASTLLSDDGFLLIYGPFKIDGTYTTASNAEFDGMLRSSGITDWRLKDVNDLSRSALGSGLVLKERIDMPSNNFILQYARI
jgi:hypothetical protein